MKVLILITLVVVLLVRRIQTGMGFQEYRKTTLTVRLVLFSVAVISLLSNATISPLGLIPDGIGIIAGLVLAYIATNHAQFEKRGESLYYKTHIWVEIVVILFFLLRMSYRLYILRYTFQSGQTQVDAQTQMEYMRDPFTSASFLAFFSYYLAYYSFVLKEAKKALAQP